MQSNQPIPLRTTGWTRGLKSLWRKEMGEWWQTRRWLVHLIIWIAVINGLMAVVSYVAPMDPEQTAPLLQTQIEVILNLGIAATTIGVIIAMQSAIIGERQSGTAAWILSKPASRSAFLLAKVGANAVSFLGLAVIIPTIIAFVEIRLFGENPAVGAYLSAVGLLVLHNLFYLALTLMLGTFFSGRGAVLGTSMSIYFGSQLVLNIVPAAAFGTPFAFPMIGMGIFGFADLPAAYPAPIVASAVWTVIFLVVAIKRFNREEL